MPSSVRRAFSVFGLLLAWEILAWARFVPQEYFPPPHAIGAALRDAIASGELVRAELSTLSRALAGLVGATLLGVSVAVFAARYPLARRALEPVAELFRPLPPAALVPIAIFFLGLGWKLYAFILIFACIWPIYLNASAALASVSRVQLHTAASFGYVGWEQTLAVQLPSALPEIFIGIRTAAGVSLIATVVAEMLAGRDGLGYFLSDAAFTLRIPDMFAGLLLAMLSGLLMNQIVIWLRGRAVGWHEGLTAANRM